METQHGYALAEDGVRIAWRLDGPRDAPAVVLCSMGGAAFLVWDEIVAALSPRWRILRYDRRGDGDSDAGDPESHTLERYTRDGLVAMDAGDVSSAHVCGMAFGARIATRIALDCPARIRSLILFDATAGPPAPEAVRAEQSALASRLRKAAGLPKTPFEDRWFNRRDPAGAGLAARALVGHPRWTSGLDGIAAPTFIACGEQDPNLSSAQRMAREIPGAVFRLMPMTGHPSLLHRPDLVLSRLRAFLRAAEARSRGALAPNRTLGDFAR